MKAGTGCKQEKKRRYHTLRLESFLPRGTRQVLLGQPQTNPEKDAKQQLLPVEALNREGEEKLHTCSGRTG